MRALKAAFGSQPPIVQAALLMTLGAISVAIQNSMIRVVSAEVHSFEVVFFRNVFGLLAMLPFMRGGGRRPPARHVPGATARAAS